MNSKSLIVFSDLDGTLLDHDTYAWDAARPALARLAALDVPVILSSSKTASEITVLQEAMGLQGLPAIVENGAGVIGLDRDNPDTADYQRIRAALSEVPADLAGGFTGFGDLTDAEVAQMTGLRPEEAARARRRQFSEPGIWRGSPRARQQFLAVLAEHGVHAREGGRFLTLSFGRTKASGMRQVIDFYGAGETIALGDAPNDIEMLEAAGHGVIIANPHRAPLPPLKGESAGRIHRTVASGPVGWNRAVVDLLDTLSIEQRQTHG